MSVLNLPDPVFIQTDPEAVEQEMVSAYEQVTGRKLYPAQLERLLIHEFAFRESLLRLAFQSAAKQNLLSFASYPILDYLGDLVGTLRIPAAKASGKVVLTAVDPPAEGVPVLAGFRVAPLGGKEVFETIESVVLESDAMSAEVKVQSVEPGNSGNGFEAGKPWEFVDSQRHLASVECSETTAGGADEEDDDSLRERIRLAPHSWSVAGSREAYIYHAKSVSTQVIDVYPESWDENGTLMEGIVRVHVLSEPLLLGTPEGTAQAETLRLEVEQVLMKDDVKPLCETLEVVNATVVTVTVSMDVTLYADADAANVAEGVTTAFGSYCVYLKASLGRDFVPSQLAALLQAVNGVYKVNVVVPGDEPFRIGLSEVCLVSEYAINYESTDEVIP